MPKALTKQAAARPLVSASMPTATGINTATSGTGMLTPPSSDWKTSHSEAKPLSGGRAEMAAEPIREEQRRPGHSLDQPAHLFHVARVGGMQHRTGAEEQQALEAGMIERVIQPADEAERGQRSSVRNCGRSAQRRCRSRMMPMFSTE